MAILHTAFLLTGGNLGDRKETLSHARNYIERKVGTILKASAYYETAAWGKEDQPHFLNQALAVETTLSPVQLIHVLLDIELQLGRTRAEKWDARIIDIDILLYDDLILDTPDLCIPHQHLHERNFTLIPLMEIAGESEHPIFKKSIEELYWASEDTLDVFLVD